MTAITFSIPADLWLSANDRRHWADKAKRTRHLRTHGYAERDKASGQAGVHTVRLVLTAQDIPWEAS
jgi:hypothetical protein